jgi:hypothetical protein
MYLTLCGSIITEALELEMRSSYGERSQYTCIICMKHFCHILTITNAVIVENFELVYTTSNLSWL